LLSLAETPVPERQSKAEALPCRMPSPDTDLCSKFFLLAFQEQR